MPRRAIPPIRVGRDRGNRIEYVYRLEMARNAWAALEVMRRPENRCEYWLAELRAALGDRAFEAGVMPNMPWVVTDR